MTLSNQRLRILDLWIDPVDMRQALDKVEAFINEGNRPHLIFASNPEKSFSVPRDPLLYETFRSADLLIPDGIGMVLAARLLYGMIINRVPGVELMHEICKIAAAKGYKVFIYGSKDEVNRKAVNKLIQTYPGLNVVGRSHGYIAMHEMPLLIDNINKSRAQILFVGLGSPKQEKWIAKYWHLLQNVRVCQGIGGTLDTIAGIVKRAPKSWQRMHVEWLYRLIKEPKRIKRQKVLPLFVLAILRQKISMTSFFYK